MIPISLAQIATIVKGEGYNLIAEQQITEVFTDSRQVVAGGLFFALVGVQFDGHDFVQPVLEQGAAAVIVSQKQANNSPQIVVSDTLKALGDLAHWLRKQVRARVVALTGSSGKTSVKEMTAAILSQCGQTCYTQGNFNNDIGVPLTLLRLTPADKFAVIELGANHIGEIAYTAQLVEPEAALINNIAAAHLQGFGSIEGVAKAKSEIFTGLHSPTQPAIINLDSCARNWFDELKGQNLKTFSLLSSQADYYASDIKTKACTHFTLHTPAGTLEVELPLIGLHNVSNAIAASALALSVGADFRAIQHGLLHVKPVKGRLYPIKLNDNQLLWDDSYNANVISMQAAIAVLARQPGYRVLVVGDMGELGKDSVKYHEQVGETAKKAGLDCVLSVGSLSQNISCCSGVGHHFDEKTQVVDYLKTLLQTYPILTILVKGSRSARMEQIIEQLTGVNASQSQH